MGAKKYSPTAFPKQTHDKEHEVGITKAHLQLVPSPTPATPVTKNKARNQTSQKQLGPISNFLVDILASIIVGFILFFLFLLIGSLKVSKSETKK